MSDRNEKPEPYRNALEKLVEKLDEVHADPRFESVWAMYHVHGGRYAGPLYTEELDHARLLLKQGPTTKAEARIETVKCGICWDVFEYDPNGTMTAGFYNCRPGAPWHDYAPEHEFLCDHCMWQTAAYRKDYGVVECGPDCKKMH